MRSIVGSLIMMALLLAGFSKAAYGGVCYFANSEYLTSAISVGDSYVPRDAPVGSVIGVASLLNHHDTKALVCEEGGTLETSFTTHPVAGVTLPSGLTKQGPIYKTSIPGVGIMIETGSFGSGWVTMGRYFVPYTMRSAYGTSWRGGFPLYITLVKIAEIPMGKNRFDSKTLMKVTSNSGERRIDYSLSGTVTRSECSVPAGAKSISVSLGTVTRASFGESGGRLASHDFGIPLVNCTGGSYPTGQAWNYFQGSNVNLLLEGAKGSSIIDSKNGMLGLTSDSESRGVAVQILQQDGTTPFELGVGQLIRKTSDGGDMMINLKARYVQVSDSLEGPQAGTANAAVNFTVTYK